MSLPILARELGQLNNPNLDIQLPEMREMLKTYANKASNPESSLLNPKLAAAHLEKNNLRFGNHLIFLRRKF